MEIPNYLDIFGSQTNNFYLEENANIIRDILISSRNKYSVEEIAKTLSVSTRVVYYYLEGKRIPSLKTIFKLIELLDDLKAKEYIYNNFEGIYTWGHHVPHKLPKFYSSELAYITGVISGDGHVAKKGYIEITNESEDYLKKIVAPIFQEIFQIIPFFAQEGNCFKFGVFSKPAHLFFNEVIGLPKGKKKGKLRVPDFIYLNNNFKKEFLRGLFETDGGFTCTKDYKISILISSSTLPFLIQVQDLLKELGVNLPGPYQSGNRKGYEIRSFRAKEILNFKNNIGILHPKKLERFNALVAKLG